MSKNENYRGIIKATGSAVILLIEIFAYAFLWLFYYNRVIEFPFWRRGIWLIAAIYAIFLIFFLYTYGGLKVGYLKVGNVIYSHILSLLIANGIAYLQLAVIDKKFHSPIAFIFLTLFDIICVIIWVFMFQYIYSIMFPPRRLLVVYGDKPILGILEKLNSREDKYLISGAVNIKNMTRVFEKIPEYEGVIIGDIPVDERNKILKKCYEMDIRVYTVPKVSDILIKTSTELNIFDTPLLLSKSDNGQIEELAFKRLVDLLLGIPMLIAALPLFMIFGILIKANDRGPIFYTQKRLTKDGKVFDIIKFRTMRTDAESDGVAKLASKKDNRITPVGKVLRATRLDELPQLINILKGDMSIVGPRPERPEIASEYEKEFPEFRYRLKVKAGLTGYAQIYGKYNTTPYDKLKLDLTYIRKYNILLDLKIIIMTPKILFMKESTEGVSDNNLQTGNIKEEIYGKADDLEKKIKK